MMGSAGTILPAVSPKPFDQMTLDELTRERAYWDRFIRDGDHHGPALGVARDCRDACDALLARRGRETKPQDLVSAITPLIAEVANEITTIRHMIDTTADPRIAAELAAEADRLGLIVDAGSRALAAATGGAVQFAIPVKLSHVPLIGGDQVAQTDGAPE